MRHSLPTLQFPFDGLPDEVRPVFPLGQYGLDPVKGPLREPGLHVLVPKFFASHVVFSHMRY